MKEFVSTVMEQFQKSKTLVRANGEIEEWPCELGNAWQLDLHFLSYHKYRHCTLIVLFHSSLLFGCSLRLLSALVKQAVLTNW